MNKLSIIMLTPGTGLAPPENLLTNWTKWNYIDVIAIKEYYGFWAFVSHENVL